MKSTDTTAPMLPVTDPEGTISTRVGRALGW
eukprot:CAMPEP_0174937130 /NCGR_PEP_ID=MMETSP1355-20121228/59672_1 /TAXON_ID=464990 /ORGANISM="Hemiselmis tepida, Strain CCMP443" /LENGTH=30 /DNA_ID= /DNA_START= /DNA_END= /DNA_ORIENTATION=